MSFRFASNGTLHGSKAEESRRERDGLHRKKLHRENHWEYRRVWLPNGTTSRSIKATRLIFVIGIRKYLQGSVRAEEPSSAVIVVSS
ncbi:uncharacterized protein FOMMEDRAFT_141422 [Fomitiporia mediterranea MF3/22]|uniref:uncharacterized protein n=1 Tax=Fomitiporia mediterranea (strain MF3/22) TaxID=694068 RepID=UPI0004408233|nr:uncharacterized protein FOMMEDRAFT_141422 [Fomitiporia mediterranea MF3/22]EJD02349.1 hypothetical protein FOMMEDRAFT_141422 [Fomitiporia mediterranea MF3/22]